MQWEFATYPEFIEEYRTYHFDECSSCGANCELGESDVECVIEDKKMYFQQLLVLKCSDCGKTYLPEAGDVMHLSQNVVETFIDRIEVYL